MSKSKIPKIIHYVWVGNNRKDSQTLKCIKSWKKYCPDYKFMEWGNEVLADIDNKYVKDAYKEKMWAFVSDYIRLLALKEYGGIYLDTDVELTAPIDKFLDNEFVLGFENYDGSININTGFIATAPDNKIVTALLETYNDSSFIKEDGTLDLTPNPQRFLKYFNAKYGVILSDGKKSIPLGDDGIIYPYYYFCKPETGKENYAIHHFIGSWLKKDLTFWQRVFSVTKSNSKDRLIISILGVKISKKLNIFQMFNF